MRARWLAGFALAAGAALWPAGAVAGSAVTITVSRGDPPYPLYAPQRYLVTVTNSLVQEFIGRIVLTNPDPGGHRSETRYQTDVIIRGHSELTKSFDVQEPSTAYYAELRDASGSLIAVAGPEGQARGTRIGFLTDHRAARADASLIPQTALINSLGVVVSPLFPDTFPNDPVQLLQSFGAVVIDGADTTQMEPDQVAALRNYVAFGGQLVLTGGTNWSHVVKGLPSELVPLEATTTTIASLAPLAELSGMSADLNTFVVTGRLHAGVVVLGQPSGPPLMVEDTYGQGGILQVTFDPLAAPPAGSEFASITWAEILNRSSRMRPPYWGREFPGDARAYGFSQFDRTPSLPEQLLRIIREPSPAETASTKGGLLPLFLLAVPASLVRLPRKRLIIVAGLAIAGLGGTMLSLSLLDRPTFTPGAVVNGSASFDREVQIQEYGPDGSVLKVAYGGVHPEVFPLHPNGVAVRLRGKATVAAPASNPYAALDPTQPVPSVTGDPATLVYPNGPSAQTDTFESVGVSTAAGGIEAELSVSNGRVRGRLANHTGQAVEQLRVMRLGQVAKLLDVLPAGQTAAVDAPFEKLPVTFPGGLPPVGRSLTEAQKMAAILEAAAGSVLQIDSYRVALVGFVPGSPSVTVNGRTPTSSIYAAMAEAVYPSVDDRVSNYPRQTSVTLSSGRVIRWPMEAIFDYVTAPKLDGRLAFQYVPRPAWEGTSFPLFAIYNWKTGSWRDAPIESEARNMRLLDVMTGEVNGGLIRVRGLEANPPGLTLN